MMASAGESRSESHDQQVPDQDETASVKHVQSHYLRCPSPSFSMMSDRFSMISGSDASSIYMEPIHLSSAIAAKKIISEELKCREVSVSATPDSMRETAEQLMVEDLYNRVKDMIDDRSLYNTPCVLDIQRALVQDRLEAPFNAVDEVWPNIYIAEKSVAVNKARLKRLGITHIVNAAHGTGVYTGEVFYQGMNITYMGIEVDDFPEADISPHFRSCAEFLDDALLTHRGKVLVDSMMGVSRSAVLVAAYLMIFQNMSIMEALLEIRKKRVINPNEGFIKQLRQLNETLMEQRDEDDDETLSQCSVIDTRARLDEEESMFGVKADSIMVDEEEDSSSVMSSVASSAAAAALKAGILGGPSKPDIEVITDDPSLPGKDREDEDGDVDSMIREWQKRNEHYQSEDWWEAQLMCDSEDGESLLGEGKRLAVRPEDLESVTSEDVRVMKERIRRRPRRPASDAGSTTSCSSYADQWKQRLKEIEEQAAARYRLKETDDDTNSESSQKKIDDDVESILSDTSSMYNFCKKNKEHLTPLERWKIKRIQFGWNKKDGAAENGEQKEGETEAPATSLEDVNLTAYQTWKLKQQKKFGGEENKDEILEMSRSEDTATVKRRQRREELLERTRKTLEESQSVCGWETESALSGTSIPLSAFCAGAFPSASVTGDDNMSVLSGRSSVLSGCSRRSQPPVPQEPPPTPAPVIGPNGETMVNIANIQNWIANVVNETLIQKQAEMMIGGGLAPSRAGSVFSLGVGSTLGPGRGVDDDKVSMLSGATSSSVMSRIRAESVLSVGGKAQSVLSDGGRAESVLSAGGASNLSSVSGLGSRKSKITTTSVPLYSLFQDQVNLQKLNTMEKEIKADMRDKMASYEVKKITEDNKRSTLYKKKKQKEEDEDEEHERGYGKTNGLDDLMARPCEKPKPKRDFGRSGILNLPASASNPTSSVDEWLQNVRPPQSKTKVSLDGDTEPRMSRPSYEETSYEPETSEVDFPSRRSSISIDEDEGEEYGFSSRHLADADMDMGRDPSPEFNYQSRTSLPSTEQSYNGLSETTSYKTRRSYDEGGSYQEYSAKPKFTHTSLSENNETVRTTKTRQDEEEDEEISVFLAQIKQRARARVAEEMKEDEVLVAWKKQEESKSQTYSKKS
ncbi:serine/threonine/tyrosine-interacting-like protein 2 [Xyrauchen texanus]|uniref:serine/threonine/tyrosine-interacting-like protein 2 n=1 Tax=Xyrauchen texanus TaxID=154827 RepID=UPI002242662A|nr:serine/threonine/tyrosine-interacting-like protein 2 [Xyrauchen texanus]